MEISNAPRPGIQSELNPIADAHPGYQINGVIYRGRGGSTMRREAVQHQTWRGRGRGGVFGMCDTEHLICHNCRMKICNKQLNSVDVVDGRMSTDCREPRKRRFCCWLWSSRVSPSSSCSPLSISLCLPLSRRFKIEAPWRARRPAPAGAKFEIVVTSTSKKHFNDGRRCRCHARRPRFYDDEQNIKL